VDKVLLFYNHFHEVSQYRVESRLAEVLTMKTSLLPIEEQPKRTSPATGAHALPDISPAASKTAGIYEISYSKLG